MSKLTNQDSKQMQMELEKQEPLVWWGNIIYERCHGLYLNKDEAIKEAWMGEENVFPLVEKAAYDKLKNDWENVVGDHTEMESDYWTEVGKTTELQAKLLDLVKHSIEMGSISKARGAEILEIPLIDMDDILK